MVDEEPEDSKKEDDDEDGGEPADEEELEDEDGDDESLAWQMLETARCILAKKPERSLMEVDVIATLADMSLEKGRFSGVNH